VQGGGSRLTRVRGVPFAGEVVHYEWSILRSMTAVTLMARWWSGVFVVALLAVGAVTSSCSDSPTAPTPTRIISLSGNNLNELAFGAVQVGTSATGTVTISNSGNSTLTWSIPGSGAGVFTGSPTSGSVAAEGSTSVTITFTPTAVISYSVTLTVTSDATTSADDTPNQIQLTGTGT